MSLDFIHLLDLPKPNYEKIWALQKSRVEKVIAGEESEAVFFCEHEPVVTLGRRSHEENILSETLSSYPIERGGDVTFHGPGQLVIYPIVKLNGSLFKAGLDSYLRFLEEIVMEAFQPLGLDLGRYGPTGVWLKRSENEAPKKIASIGVAVRRWVTYHGISLNIKKEILKGFQNIRPCNFDSTVMTSLEDEGIHLELSEVAELLESKIAYKLGLLAEGEEDEPINRVGRGASASSRPTL